MMQPIPEENYGRDTQKALDSAISQIEKGPRKRRINEIGFWISLSRY